MGTRGDARRADRPTAVQLLCEAQWGQVVWARWSDLSTSSRMRNPPIWPEARLIPGVAGMPLLWAEGVPRKLGVLRRSNL